VVALLALLSALPSLGGPTAGAPLARAPPSPGAGLSATLGLPSSACSPTPCPSSGGSPGWSSISGAPSPSARAGASIAYDSADGYLVLFGGYEAYARPPRDLNDTWTFRAGVWQPISPVVSPSPRSDAVFATDPATGCLLLFGGYNDTSRVSLGDTWRFCGDVWTPVMGSVSPPARYSAAAAADPACGCIVLFGGRASPTGAAFNDTWRFSGGSWSEASTPSAPSPRSDAAMAWDAALSALILYGGRNASGASLLGGTWGYSSLGWQALAPATSPGLRADYGLASLPGAQGVELFGGTNGANATNDSWTFVSGSWEVVALSGAPPARAGVSYAFDEADNYTLLFGGENATNRPVLWYGDTWVTGGEYVAFSESGLPPATAWSVSLNGSTNSSTTSSIGFEVGGGSYPFLVGTISGRAYGVRYLPSRGLGTLRVRSSPLVEGIGYAQQDYLRTAANPASAGFTSPVTEWVAPGTPVELFALPIPGYHFTGWSGMGPGNYSGMSNPLNLSLGGGVNETANFAPATTYAVEFSELGLSGGTDWTVTVDGLPYAVDGANLSVPLANGTYAWSAAAAAPGNLGLKYVASPSAGNFTVSGESRNTVVGFQLYALFNSSVGPGGNGAIAPASGWYAVGSSITLLAEPAGGYSFTGWQGSGPGAYSGDSPGVTITLGGPVSEVANFAAQGPAPLWGATVPLWFAVAMLALVGAVAVVATIVLLGSRPPKPR
jgi:hypothetical protein